MTSLKHLLVRSVRTPARIVLKDSVQWLRRRAGMRRSLAEGRLRGTLAIHGGQPVRDVRFRPWPEHVLGTKREWRERVGPALRTLFLRGPEGKPQPLARDFERRWAAHCQTPHALLLPHGTDALRIALAAALDHDGLEHGGEVIVPNLSFVASSTACFDRRLGVALVDVDPDTMLIDPQRVAEAIRPGRTRAIMAVHLFGQPADMAALRSIADANGLKLIEDAAQAHGAVHELGPVGALGDAGAFSFQSSKNMSSGEGGALTTGDAALFDRAFELHDAGRTRIGGQRWAHESLGWNVRPTEYVAAVLLARLARLPEESERRARNHARLSAMLAEVPCLEPLTTKPWVRRHGAHMLVARYRAEACGGLSIGDFLSALRAEGLPVGPLYSGLTQAQQPALRRLRERRPDYVRVLDTPVADAAVRELVWLPQDLLLGDDSDVEEIAAACRKVQAHYDATASKAARPAPSAPPEPRSAIARTPATLRFGIIGVGEMGSLHAAAVGRVTGARVTAVADAQADRAREVAERLGCHAFDSAEALLRSGEVDAVVVATPHLEHPRVSAEALRAGMHVVCEKPLAVTAAEADEVLAAAAASSARFAVVLQNRLEPVWQQARTLLESGELGPIVRGSIVETAWRHAGYFAAAPWRGTWRGEGGGVLVNQAPHALDRYVWLCGAPDSVLARCDTRVHAIEVEDTASAILRHANGAHGYLHVSTAEAPRVSRTVVSCDRGRLVVEDGRLRVERLRGSLREASLATGARPPRLPVETHDIATSVLGDIPRQLDAFYANFLAAVAGREELVCPGAEGARSVELANAMMLSSALGHAVELPLDRARFQVWFDEKVGVPERAR